MEIELLIREDDLNKYSDFILKQEKTNILSSILFERFLWGMTETFSYYLVAKENNKIIGALPAFISGGKYGAVINSLPWFGSNPGVIVDNKLTQIESFNVANALLSELYVNVPKRIDCLSATFCGYPGVNSCIYESFFKGYEVSERIGMITHLPEYNDDFTENILKLINQKTRNQVRKSYQNCISTRTEKNKPLSSSSMLSFLLEIHRENMEAIGAPVKNKEFEVMKDWILGKDCDLYVSYSKENDEPVAALFVQYFNKTVDYIMPVIVEKYRSLNPLHCLIFTAMYDAAERGLKYWNWGGTTLPQMQGVYHFKKSWGSVEYKYQYYTKLHKKLLDNITKEDLLKEYPYFYVYPFDKL